MEEYAGLIIVVGALMLGMILVRFMKRTSDEDRIRAYIEKRGGRFESVQWAPLSRGFLADKTDRFYRVEYFDAEGNRHRATCKTSGWTGEFFGEDVIVAPSPNNTNPESSEIAALKAENARLQAELEELRMRQS